jgi:hypothetical protein
LPTQPCPARVSGEWPKITAIWRTVAITEATIASQRNDEHPSLFYIETDTTLKALAVVAARIAFETNIADTAAKGATFAEKHAEMVGQTLEALRKSGDEHPFARVWGASRWQGAAEEEWMTGFGMAVDPQERT